MSALDTTGLFVLPGCILDVSMKVDREKFGKGLVDFCYDTNDEDYVLDLEYDLENYNPRYVLVLVWDKIPGKCLKSTYYYPPYFQ